MRCGKVADDGTVSSSFTAPHVCLEGPRGFMSSTITVKIGSAVPFVSRLSCASGGGWQYMRLLSCLTLFNAYAWLI